MEIAQRTRVFTTEVFEQNGHDNWYVSIVFDKLNNLNDHMVDVYIDKKIFVFQFHIFCIKVNFIIKLLPLP